MACSRREGIAALRKKKLFLGESGQMLSNQLLENTLLVVQSVKKKRIGC
jgi:hypothetical protein